MRTIAYGLLIASVGFFGSTRANAQNCDRVGISAATYRRILYERFAALYNPKPGGVPGTFASLDIKDAEATFSNTAVFDSGAVLNVKASGGVAEGILPILNNHVLNSKLGLDVQLHFLRRGQTSLQYTNPSCVAYKAALLKASNDSALAVVEISNRSLHVLQAVEIERLTHKLRDLSTTIDTSSVKPRKDSLIVERAKVETLIQQVRAREIPSDPAQLETVSRNAAAAVRAAPSLLVVRGHSFGWWSLGYGLSNTTFRLFDPAAAFDSQVEKSSYASHRVGLSYSHYAFSSGSGETRFFTAGINVGIADNLAALTKVELTDTKNFGPTPQERVGTSKYTAYQGAYERNLATATLSADYYTFVLFKNQGAIHLYPAIKVQDGTAPTYSAGAGFLVVSRKEDKSILNAELYFNFNDLTNAGDSESGFFGRTGLGLRFTFPLTFGPAT
jgi:hypothetical protein